MTNLAVNKNIKSKKNFPDNHIQNILRVFDILPNFLSQQVKQCAIITYKHCIYELPHEFPKKIRLRTLGD